MHGGYMYQAFASTVITIDPTTGDVMSSVSLGEYGDVEPVVDLAIHDERLLALVRNTEVAELVLRNPRRPRIARRVSAAEMGVTPHRFSVVTDDHGPDVFVCGGGGVVRWSDQRKFLRNSDTCSSVANSQYGLVATRGKQVVTIADGEFVGSASTLHEIPGHDNLVFTRRATSGTLVGVMTPNVREVDAIDGTRSVPGDVQTVRFFDGAAWLVANDRILAIEPDGTTRHWISVKGAIDVMPINTNYVAISGSFGRAVYRIHVDKHGNGDTFVRVTRTPSRLKKAKTDGRYILAGSEEGSWLYLIGAHADLVEQTFDSEEIPRSAAVAEAEAIISADGYELLITFPEQSPITYRERDDAQLHTVIAVDGHFWVGHDDGITILHPQPQIERHEDAPFDVDAAMVRDRIVLDGPVRHIFPLSVGDGVSYVAEMGGFGVAEIRTVPIDELPPDDIDD